MGRARRIPAAAVLRRGHRVGRHRGAAPAAAGSGCRGRRRCSTGSTVSSSRADSTCSPSSTVRSGIRSPTPRAPIATRGSSPCSAARRSAGCRSSRSAAGSSSSTSRGAARCTSTCPRRSARSGTASAAASSRRTRSWSTTARGSRGWSAPERSTCTATTTRGSTGSARGSSSTARTDDGLVQAFESDGDGYVVGVQWHPEENAEDRRLFAGLVAAASEYSTVPSRGCAAHEPAPSPSSTPRPAAALAEVPRASEADVDAAIARAVVAQRGWAALAAGGARRRAARVRPRRRGARRGARAARGAQLRASDRVGAVGGVARRAGAQLLRRRARAAERPADPGRRRARRHLPRAVRRGRASSCRGTSR